MCVSFGLEILLFGVILLLMMVFWILWKMCFDKVLLLLWVILRGGGFWVMVLVVWVDVLIMFVKVIVWIVWG